MEALGGKVAVVTGGGSGIGRATAHSLGRRGVSVVVADIDSERAESVARELSDLGGAATGLRCDVAQDEDVAKLREVALERYGRVDIVMNNVGVLVVGLPEVVPVSAYQRVFDVCCLSVVRSLTVFLPGLIEQGSGHIVNTASTAGLYAYSFERLPYSAAKGAVVALSEALALYTRPRGIGVTCLCPGPTKTNIAEQMETIGDIPPVKTPTLAWADPADVGELVVDAIQRNIFLVTTHPEVNDILAQRASDPDGFIDSQIAKLGGPR